MKKLAVLLMLAVMFFAVVSVGCVGSSDNDSSNSEQTESLNEDTGDYDPNRGGRGTTDATVDLSTIKLAALPYVIGQLLLHLSLHDSSIYILLSNITCSNLRNN